ncbi:MAG: DUF1223 domain-containing protein [Geminicoccaceae bacterium]
MTRRLAAPTFALALLAGSDIARSADQRQPVVVELFTSQSCYSCPPAEAYLAELANKPDVLALEWHVDYWDDLVYGAAGQWRDPFSDPAYTERQVAYNLAIRGSGRIYTPQMVIDGADEAVGSRREQVRAAIERAGQNRRSTEITLSPAEGHTLTVKLDGALDQPADVWLVRYLRAETTEVERGENHGKRLTNHHIVREVEKLGAWRGGEVSFTFNGASEEMGCAILVQRAPAGSIQGARSCDLEHGA